jgi:hypothetical protein
VVVVVVVVSLDFFFAPVSDEVEELVESVLVVVFE